MESKEIKKKELESFTKNIKGYLKANNALLKKHKLVAKTFINFPNRSKLPLIIKFCLWVIAIGGGSVDTRYTSTRKK